MNTKMKKELISDMLTGLAVAAVFTAIAPVEALAQLTAVSDATEGSILRPMMQFASYASYGMGTVLTIAGISSAKKHADNPGQNPLGHALGKLGAGAAFLTAPSVAGMLADTSTESGMTAGANLSTFTP